MSGGSGSPFAKGFLAGAAFLAACIGAAYALGGFEIVEESLPEQARDAILENYWREVEPRKLDEGSVGGMVQEIRRLTDDRFSHYFSPEDLAEFNEATSGQFSGVGLTVSEVPRGLRVAAVLPDSPAEQADLGVGDVIVGVNGRSIAGVPSDVSTARIKGEPGTEVRLRVDPAGPSGPRAVTLERASVRIPAADGELRRAGGQKVAWVRYATFSRGASEELRDEIERLSVRGAEGIVLDLRGNGGGLLNEAVLSASLFVEDGEIVRTRSRTRGTEVYDALGDALDERPLVVLVNRDTASAAEILAAAIQHYELGAVVGEPTFGKGTFQEVIHLPDGGGALDLTIGEYLTAAGVSLAGRGVKPENRAADDPRTEDDEALDAALRELAGELP